MCLCVTDSEAQPKPKVEGRNGLFPQEREWSEERSQERRGQNAAENGGKTLERSQERRVRENFRALHFSRAA